MRENQLTRLRDEERELRLQAQKLNDRRKRVFKAWFKRTFWQRYMTHTRGMNPQPLLSNFVYTKKLDDTYRGAPKDMATTKDPGDHGYGHEVRLSWANELVQMGLEIVLDSSELTELFLQGDTVSTRMLFEWIEQAITEAINELIEQYQPESPARVKAHVRLPEGLMTNRPITQLLREKLTVGSALVNKR